MTVVTVVTVVTVETLVTMEKQPLLVSLVPPHFLALLASLISYLQG